MLIIPRRGEQKEEGGRGERIELKASRGRKGRIARGCGGRRKAREGRLYRGGGGRQSHTNARRSPRH